MDCVIFTGGVGENSTVLHNLVCDGLIPLCHDNFSRKRDICDVTSDDAISKRSDVAKDVAMVTTGDVPGRRTRVLIIKTNEELAIAEECLNFLTY